MNHNYWFIYSELSLHPRDKSHLTWYIVPKSFIEFNLQIFLRMFSSILISDIDVYISFLVVYLPDFDIRVTWASLVSHSVKNLPSVQETQVRSLGGKIPWGRKWQSTPISLPGKSHGQRNLGGLQSMGVSELGKSEQIRHSRSMWASGNEMRVFPTLEIFGRV